MTKDKVSWKDTNLALIGSELDHKIKQAAAQGEPAWEGMGQTPEVRVWRIEKFQVKPWPKERYGQFHKGDSYIVMNTYKKGTSDALNHDIHIWIGAESSQDEYGTAAYKMVEADDYLGGVPVQHRQVEGHETPTFHSYFGGAIEYLDGGIESGFNHVEPNEDHPVLFRVKGTKKNMSLTQVPLSKNSLNEGDSFILYAGKAKVWCWHGKDAKPLEKANSNQWAEHMCTMSTVVTLDQGQGDDEEGAFWELLGDGTIGPDLGDDEEVKEFEPLLYRVDGDLTKELELVATGAAISKGKARAGAIFKRSALDNDDVFLVDSGWEIYVWVGSGADRHEKIAAMSAADKYSKKELRTLELPVHIVKSGHENESFLSLFE